MIKPKDRMYRIRSVVPTEDSRTWHDLVGSGCYARDAGTYRISVTAWDGPGSWDGESLHVVTDSPEEARRMFRFLWSRYWNVRVNDSAEDGECYSVLNLPDEYSPPVTRVCCAPVTQIEIGVELTHQRDVMLALAAKRLLPKKVRSRNSTGPLNPRSRARILERDGFRCKRCGAGPEKAALEVDHIIPRAKGGTNDETNLQTLCWSCNRGKGASDPHPTELSA